MKNLREKAERLVQTCPNKEPLYRRIKGCKLCWEILPRDYEDKYCPNCKEIMKRKNWRPWHLRNYYARIERDERE